MLKLVAAVLACALVSTPASALVFQLDPAQSDLEIIIVVEVFGAPVPAEVQFPGTAETTYSGTVETLTVDLGTLDFPGGGAADAATQLDGVGVPWPIAPDIGGVEGSAPADYGVRIDTVLNIDLPPFTDPDTGAQIDLGTLESVVMDLAQRDTLFDVTSAGPLPVTLGAFDSSQLTMLLSGSLDVDTTIVLQQDNFFQYLANLAILEGAAASPELDLDVSGDIFSLEITLDLAVGVPLDAAPLLNEDPNGLVADVDGDTQLTIPLLFTSAPETPTGVVDVFTTLQGQFVATAIPECGDGFDNDGDGLTDAPDDPGCDDPSDLSEKSPALECDDAADNDGDGLADYLADASGDPGCRGPDWIEAPACQNGLDDDLDGTLDFDGGASANGGVALGDPDPHCAGDPTRQSERPAGCGLGAELAFLLPGLAALRRRRRA